MVFSLAGGLLASFLILGMSWVGGGVFVFSLEFFMGAGHLLSAQLLHWWRSPGPDLVWRFQGCSGNPLEGTVALWRILGSCCCCFLPAAGVMVPLMLMEGRCWGLPGVNPLVMS